MERQNIRQAVILAGGMGTRLKPFTDHLPKPLYPICEKPFIGYLAEQVRCFGIERILVLSGYMADKIEDFLKDGSDYGVHVSYDVTPPDFLTGDRIVHARDLLDDVFLLMYCDNYCPVNFNTLVNDFYANEAWVQVSVYENKDHYTKSNMLVDESGRVVVYDKERKYSGLQGVDIGYALIRKSVIDFISCSNQSFEKAVYSYATENRKLYATMTKHRYYSIGSWERMELTRHFFENKPTVFIDRDGTINKKADQACYIESWEQFIWLDGAKAAIKLLKDNGFRVLMITNQPGIARGNLTREGLEIIHENLQKELKQIGAEIDKIYVCPHGWDEGCECRKPKPGMLYQAQKDYDLNLTKCVLIGDDIRDMEAGRAAGCRTYQVTEQRSLLQIAEELVDGIAECEKAAGAAE